MARSVFWPRSCESLYRNGVEDFPRENITDLKTQKPRGSRESKRLRAIDSERPDSRLQRTDPPNDLIGCGISDEEIGAIQSTQVNMSTAQIYESVMRADTCTCIDTAKNTSIVPVKNMP